MTGEQLLLLAVVLAGLANALCFVIGWIADRLITARPTRRKPMLQIALIAAASTGVLCWAVTVFVLAVAAVRWVRGAPLDSSLLMPCESAVCRQMETEHLVTSDGLVCAECRFLVTAA
ncbi:hypothetical protein [Streptomyces sp. NPDC058620]|uniref:hypothetical protein n=1 Tax=Streptomyces sp. NPDC058620 TaxID=3346560 RepID=UPI00364CF955